MAYPIRIPPWTGLLRNVWTTRRFSYVQQFQCGPPRKVNVRLIYDDDDILVVVEDISHRIQVFIDPGGRIGIWEDNSAVLLVIIFFHYPELLIQRLALIGDPVKIRPHRVEGIGDVRETASACRS